MEKKKIYIIFTFALTTIGGGELYTAGKANYMKKLGWKVYACTGEVNKKGYALISSLNEYIEKGCGWTFLWSPPYKFKIYEQENILNFMIQTLDLKNFNDCEIIIETHFSSVAFWGELLAERVKGRHFFSTCEETYRYDGIYYYEENLDFFYFKWQRNEIICNNQSCNALFNGYKNVTAPLYDMPPIIHEQYPIQDIDFPVDAIQKLDWNICHIGRIAKPYVPDMLKGVAELARRHPDKKINLIFVGNTAERRNLILETFKGISNMFVTELGDRIPIPRSLFSKVDVVCAISQSARFAANEGILTIVGSATFLDRTPGVLGYDTEEQVRGEGTFSYVEALENVLVKRLYDNKKYSLPKLKPDEEYYDNFFTILKNAAPTKEYYTKTISKERIRNWTAVFPFGKIAKGARIILFGATDIAKDYRKQIQSQANFQLEIGRGYIKQFSNTPPNYEIAAIVDEHPENFDDAVSGIERLNQKDYDAILITVFPQQAQDIYNKIVQIVPDMANRIVYDLKTIQL